MWNWGAKKPHVESVIKARDQETADETPDAAVAAASTMVESVVLSTRVAASRSPNRSRLAQRVSTTRRAAVSAASSSLGATGGRVGNDSTASAGRQEQEKTDGEKAEVEAESGEVVTCVAKRRKTCEAAVAAEMNESCSMSTAGTRPEVAVVSPSDARDGDAADLYGIDSFDGDAVDASADRNVADASGRDAAHANGNGADGNVDDGNGDDGRGAAASGGGVTPAAKRTILKLDWQTKREYHKRNKLEIYNTNKPFFNVSSAQEALSAALRLEIHADEDGGGLLFPMERINADEDEDVEHCPKVSREVAKIYVSACEGFVVQVMRQWENDIRSWSDDTTRAGSAPSRILPSQLKYAFATWLGDRGDAEAELRRGQQLEESNLSKYFSQRATKNNIMRAISPDWEYEIKDEAVLLMRQALWGRALALARYLLAVCPRETKFISEKIFLAALKYPRPLSWGIRVMI